MPEGDSYTYASDRITPVLVGERITHVTGTSPSVRRRSAAMLDGIVASVRTWGKHLLIDLQSGMSVHVHLGMSGRVRVTAAGEGLGRHGGEARLALSTERGTVWIVGAPTVEVDRRRVIDHSLRHLGPDLLASEFDLERFRDIAARYPGERTVSDFLLDQRVMAGVGNEYKSEVLFLEGMSPDRSMAAVDESQRERLAERARILLAANAGRAVRSTTGQADGTRWVYDRARRPCRRCRTAIVEGWIGHPPRITYWCPSCQT